MTEAATRRKPKDRDGGVTSRTPETLLVAFWLGLRIAIPDDAAGPGLDTLVACLPIAGVLGITAIRASRRQVVLPPARWTLPFVALAAWTLVACLWAPAAYAALDVTLMRWSEASIVGLTLLACSHPEGRRQLVAVLGGLAAMCAAYAIVQWVWIQPWTAAEFERLGLIERVPVEERGALLSRLGSRRATGTFAVANTLAGFLVMTLPILSAGALTPGSRSTRVASAGLAVLALLGILASGSKGGIVALALVAGAMAWSGGSRWRRGCVIGAGIAAIILALAIPQLGTSLEQSASVRIGYWQTAAEVWREAPVQGIGPGQFDDGFFRHKTPEVEEARHAHNAYLEIAAETGVIGLALFLAAWFWPLAAGRGSGGTAAATGDTGAAGRVIWREGGAGAAAFGMLAGVGLAILVGGVLSAGIGASSAAHLGLRATILLVAGAAYAAIVRVEVPRRLLVIGGLGLLAHAAIDFDLQVPGLAAAGVLLIALAAPRTRTRERDDLGTVAMTTLIVGGLLGALAVLRFVGVQDLLADGGRPQFLEAPVTTEAELQERIAAARSAEFACPIDPALPRRSSHLHQQLAATQPLAAARARAEAMAEAVDATRRALAVDPRDPGLCFELAQLLHEQATRTGDAALLTQATLQFERAVLAYDANPRFHFALADALEATDPARAREEYAAALERDARIYERNRARLGLTDEERARAQRR